MLRLLLDENFDHDVLRGIRSHLPDADLATVQDIGLSGRPDPEILAWAAAHDRILATRDLATMPRYAYERVMAGQPMPGVFAIPDGLSIRDAIDELVLLIAGSDDKEWENRVLHLPLR